MQTNQNPQVNSLQQPVYCICYFLLRQFFFKAKRYLCISHVIMCSSKASNTTSRVSNSGENAICWIPGGNSKNKGLIQIYHYDCRKSRWTSTARIHRGRHFHMWKGNLICLSFLWIASIDVFAEENVDILKKWVKHAIYMKTIYYWTLTSHQKYTCDICAF